MTDKNILNSKDFYKSFKKSQKLLTSFFKHMHKRAVEHMFAELDLLLVRINKN